MHFRIQSTELIKYSAFDVHIAWKKCCSENTRFYICCLRIIYIKGFNSWSCWYVVFTFIMKELFLLPAKLLDFVLYLTHYRGLLCFQRSESCEEKWRL